MTISILTPETATSHHICTKLSQMARGEIQTAFVFQRPDKPGIVINVEIMPIPKKVRLYTNNYGSVLVNCELQTVNDYIYDLELNRVLLIAVKLFAMSFWTIQHEELSFISHSLKTKFEVINSVQRYHLDLIRRHPHRFLQAGQMIQISFREGNYIIEQSSWSHYEFFSAQHIAMVRKDGLKAHYTSDNKDLVRFVLNFITAVVDDYIVG